MRKQSAMAAGCGGGSRTETSPAARTAAETVVSPSAEGKAPEGTEADETVVSTKYGPVKGTKEGEREAAGAGFYPRREQPDRKCGRNPRYGSGEKG
ncbi:hypothetical protein AALB39_14335 [Lachnospiraceae bacterium 54-53]